MLYEILAVALAWGVHATGLYEVDGVLTAIGLWLLCDWALRLCLTPSLMPRMRAERGRAAFDKALEVQGTTWLAACIAAGLMFGWAGLGICVASGAVYLAAGGLAMRMSGRGRSLPEED